MSIADAAEDAKNGTTQTEPTTMNTQIGIDEAKFVGEKRVPRHQRFLAEMGRSFGGSAAVVNRTGLPQSMRGHPPIGMLLTYLLQQ